MKFLILVASILINMPFILASEKEHIHKEKDGHDHKKGPGNDHKHFDHKGREEGNGHTLKEHFIQKGETLKIGKHHIDRLIKKGKLLNSWSKATYIDSVKKKFNNETEWVLKFKNDKSVKNKTLFIFLSLSGKFTAANFTGK